MHKKMIQEATEEQLREFVNDALSMLKETNKETYDTLELHLYKEIYGCHFNEWLMQKAFDSMINEDGTKGNHWNLDQTNSVARQVGFVFDEYNQYDWCYTMNMLYSDYYGVFNGDGVTYGKLAKKFLEDKDSIKGKALMYYLKLSK